MKYLLSFIFCLNVFGVITNDDVITYYQNDDYGFIKTVLVNNKQNQRHLILSINRTDYEGKIYISKYILPNCSINKKGEIKSNTMVYSGGIYNFEKKETIGVLNSNELIISLKDVIASNNKDSVIFKKLTSHEQYTLSYLYLRFMPYL